MWDNVYLLEFADGRCRRFVESYVLRPAGRTQRGSHLRHDLAG